MIRHDFDFIYSRVEEEQEEGGVQYVGVCVCEYFKVRVCYNRL